MMLWNDDIQIFFPHVRRHYDLNKPKTFVITRERWSRPQVFTVKTPEDDRRTAARVGIEAAFHDL